MLGDIREFVEKCPVCQMEKYEHQVARGELQSTQILEEKWKEFSIDFIMDMPVTSSNQGLHTNYCRQSYAHGTPCTMLQKHNCGSYCPVIVE